jgi:hypothetical protein
VVGVEAREHVQPPREGLHEVRPRTTSRHVHLPSSVRPAPSGPLTRFRPRSTGALSGRAPAPRRRPASTRP